MSFSKATVQLPKYQQVVEAIKNEILSGRYQPGQKLPSEAASRETVRGIPDHGRSGASRTAAGRADSKPGGIGKLCRTGCRGRGFVVRLADPEPWGYRDFRPYLPGNVTGAAGAEECASLGQYCA